MSDLDVHCLLFTLFGVSRLKWVILTISIYTERYATHTSDMVKHMSGFKSLVLNSGTVQQFLYFIGPQLKVVGTMSVGLEHIDLQECARRGIKVGYTPDVLTDAVAEETIALTLATARRFKEGEHQLSHNM